MLRRPVLLTVADRNASLTAIENYDTNQAAIPGCGSVHASFSDAMVVGLGWREIGTILSCFETGRREGRESVNFPRERNVCYRRDWLNRNIL